MMQKTIHLIAAARPNFMKVAPLFHALIQQSWCKTVLVHTGQHYDPEMSDAFFTDLKLPKPHIHLGIGKGTHGEQTGAIIMAYEKVCLENRPDLVVVVGDVNSTLACTIAAKKLNIAVAHLEAGLRSRDMSMPEEINRIMTDAVADLLWTPSQDAEDNLKAEGASKRSTFVGNIMIDSYEMLKPQIQARNFHQVLMLEKDHYMVATLHRPANVDQKDTLNNAIQHLIALSKHIKVVFPVHPRTESKLKEFGLKESLEKNSYIKLMKPLGYIDFMSLVENSAFIVTDSGGVQEETSYLGIRCFTLRSSTERPTTIELGTNILANMDNLLELIASTPKPQRKSIPLWDGQTAPRVVASIQQFLS